VRLLAALEAEDVLALARHLVHPVAWHGPDGEGTTGPGAPPDVLARALLHEGPDHERGVTTEEPALQGILKRLGRAKKRLKSTDI
jgi:hypothetical protein